MAVRIDKKIKGYSVVSVEDGARDAAATSTLASSDCDSDEAAFVVDNIIHMHERIERPEVLIGSTYKIKSPLVEHALYVTINDIVLNASTQHEQRRPFEIFINSKSMEHFQWIVALTRIMSAVFRKGGDVTFLVDEMKAVFDPKGGYFKAGGVYMPSLVAELGSIVEQHLKTIGLLHDPHMSEQQRNLLAEKRRLYEQRTDSVGDPVSNGSIENDQDVAVTGDGVSFPPSASLCHKCHSKALVILDGCATCLNCGYSKCG